MLLFLSTNPREACVSLVPTADTFLFYFLFFAVCLLQKASICLPLWPGIHVCIRVSMAEMAIPSARKRPAARIWA